MHKSYKLSTIGKYISYRRIVLLRNTFHLTYPLSSPLFSSLLLPQIRLLKRYIVFSTCPKVVAVRVGETYWADRRARPEVFVVNSTNEAKMRSAKNLQEQYEKNGVLPSMRAACRAFSEVTGREWKGEVKFSYAQGLQYGNMGCGFACALNEVRLLRGDFENRIVQPGDRVTKKVKKEIKVDGEVISFVDEEIDKEKSVDRSIRVSMQEEARLRARLVLFTAATEGSISEKYKSIRTFDFRKLGTSPGESKT
ncbi:hypothetical protein AAMO2058_001626600 [Amorphochlora amoebiformis]